MVSKMIKMSRKSFPYFLAMSVNDYPHKLHHKVPGNVKIVQLNPIATPVHPTNLISCCIHFTSWAASAQHR